ncbi:MAG: ABC transporter ATP-binding protein [Candidatus Omnitrophica bacterium]|nr:ABC transporter ATP-binding protein [Candidatus Omnitrophota bacterium]
MAEKLWGLPQKFARLIYLIKKFGLDLKVFTLCGVLSIFAALFEGVAMALLLPVINGMMYMDFNYLYNMKIVQFFLNASHIDLQGNSVYLYLALLFLILFFSVLKNLFKYASSFLIMREAGRVTHYVRVLLFRKYMDLGKQFLDTTSESRLGTVINTFTINLEWQFLNIQEALTGVFILFVYFVMMFTLSWQMTIGVFVLFIVSQGLLGIIISKIRKTSSHQANWVSEINSKVLDLLRCITLIKAYNKEDREFDQYKGYSATLKNIQLSMAKKATLLEPLRDTFNVGILLLIVIMTVVLVAKFNFGNIPRLLLCFVILRRVSNAFGNLNSLGLSVARLSGELKLIMDMMDYKEPRKVISGNRMFNELKKAIDFRGLSFKYAENKPVLHDVTFTVPAKKMVAIVGASGSGKTTIASLLLRFYDCSPGAIFMDDVDIRDFTAESLRRKIAYVSQEVNIFNDTLRANILYGLDQDISSGEIDSALKSARLYEFVRCLPNGLDTQIGDKGIRLSGGEKQRISILRAILKKSEILILDEATSSLDTLTERQIQEAIDASVKDKTVIVIAHRLSTIKNADIITVLEEGRVIEKGSMSELLQKQGQFHRYWSEQKFS